MKKKFRWLLILLMALAAVSLCSCDLLDKIIGELETMDAVSTESSESMEESSSQEESSAVEESSSQMESSEEESSETQQSRTYTKEDFVGVWRGVTDTQTMILLNEDGTLMYYEFGNPFYDYNKGRSGKWTFSENGRFDMEVVLSAPYKLFAMNEDGKMYLECSNSTGWKAENVFKDESFNPLEVEIMSSEKCSIMLPDGLYMAMQPDTISITAQDGYLTIKGDVKECLIGQYEITIGDRYSSTIGEFTLPIAKDCEIIDGGGEGGYTSYSLEEMMAKIANTMLEVDLQVTGGYVTMIHRTP